MLIVPERFFAQFTEGELAAAFCHEVAHIRRHDFLLNLIYEVLLLPLSYHPLAALIKTRVNQSRELACDEMAARLSTPEAYARSLLSIAQSINTRQSAAASGYALGLFDTNTLEERIMILLDKTNRLSKSWGRVLAIGAVGCLVMISLGASMFSVQLAQFTGAPTNDIRVGPHLRIAKIIFTATASDKSEMDVDAFARQIEGLGNLRPEYWLQEVNERTRDFWQSHGFFQAKVDVEPKLLSATRDEQLFSVTARVNAGAQFRLKKLEFSGAKVFTTPELEVMIPLRPGELFSTAKIREGLDSMHAAYASKGYKQFVITPGAAVDNSDHTITLTLAIAEGPPHFPAASGELSKPESRGGTAMILQEQSDSPARLIATTHTLTDLLSAAKLKNVSSQQIVSYRIGLKIVYPHGKGRVVQGSVISIPSGLPSGATIDVPAQAFSPSELLAGSPSGMRFYVSEVHFATGGTWKARLGD